MRKRCIAINQKTGLPCKLLAIEGLEYCHTHDPSPERIQTRQRVAKSGGDGYRGLMSLTEFEVRDTLDISEAVRLIIQDLIQRGLKNASIKQFTELTKLYMELERHSKVPAKLRELEKIITEKQGAGT